MTESLFIKRMPSYWYKDAHNKTVTVIKPAKVYIWVTPGGVVLVKRGPGVFSTNAAYNDKFQLHKCECGLPALCFL